ncbi:restriction endonuclease [Vibrio alginolyticus]|uniref:restriction endonuclease n=1 Tax=Vibrio alginolyticus TaxID=663 RepID=UPI00215D2FBB|nr:restriction endonuclease [Vibrio alginolyticus]MCZ4387843.1 restriction endonuclease [Vibrio alginolyticus]
MICNNSTTVRYGYQFEHLMKEILRANNWDVKDCAQYLSLDVDIVASELSDSELVAFELKFTRNMVYPTSALKNAAEKLVKSVSQTKIQKAVLIVAAEIREEIKEKIERDYKIQVLDLDAILSLATVDLDLLSEFLKLKELDTSDRMVLEHLNVHINPRQVNYETVNTSHDDALLGEELLKELYGIPAGREGCYAYEDIVTKILKFLFENDLSGWYEQKQTADDLHRYDLICRALEGSNVWRFISHNLDSRYILFEFKNYKEEIGQAQIYSTEKYLYEKAKRKTCFLISRKGASKSAQIACAGAMREHGKLIICLSDSDLVDFIHCKVSGEDHNELLFEKVDSFMMELPR